MTAIFPITTALTVLTGLSTLSGIAIAQPIKVAQPQPVTIRFMAKVGNQPFSCGATYRLGNPASPLTLEDFRFYVSDLTLMSKAGKTVPITLEQDNKWQHKTVALLDFENKTGACTNGTPETRDRVVGQVPPGNYTGLTFTLGVPFALNHSDATLAPSPLNLTGLWWNWQLGYKFARIDLQNSTAKSSSSDASHTPQSKNHGASSGFPIHLGSTGCQTQSPEQTPKTCINPNRASVKFSNFNIQNNIVVADLAKLVANTTLSRNQAKTAPGCMSEPEDRDCSGIMTQLGLSFMGKSASPQTFFRVQ
jgi:uncharacterized repeat protein (TIGR04052 family)